MQRSKILAWMYYQMQGTVHGATASPACGEYEIEMPPPLSLSELPPALAHTLQHIVSKLDMMTQVIGMVDERLSLNEDKMAGMEAAIASLTKKESLSTQEVHQDTLDQQTPSQ